MLRAVLGGMQLYEKEGHYLGAEHSVHGNVVKVRCKMAAYLA